MHFIQSKFHFVTYRHYYGEIEKAYPISVGLLVKGAWKLS